MVSQSDKYRELADLLQSGLEGNQAAYAKFLDTITRFLRRMVGRRLAHSDVEDVVQEVLISIHKARHTYNGQRPIMPWLVSIANFRITDHLRKHYAQLRHQTIDIDELENILVDVTKDATNYESINELLEGVPEKQKQILTMMHVEDYTAKEVGVQLNMKESAVKVAAHRAMKKIREKFGT